MQTANKLAVDGLWVIKAHGLRPDNGHVSVHIARLRTAKLAPVCVRGLTLVGCRMGLRTTRLTHQPVVNQQQSKKTCYHRETENQHRAPRPHWQYRQRRCTPIRACGTYWHAYEYWI